MAEYINRKALRTTYTKWRNIQAKIDDDYGYGLMDDVLRELDAQPAADVEPVRHGRWEMRPTGMETDTGPEYKAYCTVCNEPNKQYQPPYCPHCGAKMDKEVSK